MYLQEEEQNSLVKKGIISLFASRKPFPNIAGSGAGSVTLCMDSRIRIRFKMSRIRNIALLYSVSQGRASSGSVHFDSPDVVQHLTGLANSL